MYDCDSFKAVGEIAIPLMETQTRERNEIVGIQKSQDENYLAVITGKNLILDEQKQNELFVFRRHKAR